jgi:hypothetical protein
LPLLYESLYNKKHSAIKHLWDRNLMLMNPFLAMISEVGLTEEFCVDFVKGRKKCLFWLSFTS